MTIGGQTFSVTQAGAPCTFTISPTSSNLTTSAATTGTVTVTAGAGCSWSGTSNVGWITITAGASGSGNGSVSYSVAANAGTTSRTGTMTIGGQTFTVTQAGAPCTFTISPTSSNLTTSAATTGTVTVTAGTGCSWTAVSNDAWITVTAGASGSANGSVSYSVAANAGTTSRTGTMTIGGQTFSVTQAGAPCTFTICTDLIEPHHVGRNDRHRHGDGGRGLQLDGTSNVAWITITAGASGSGNGSVSYSVAANAGTTSRTGTMTIGGQTFSVTQAGAPCTFSIAPASSNLTTSAATTGTVTVTAGTGCSWTAVSNAAWITVTAGASGSGNGSVSYSVAANTGTTTRIGTVMIGGQTFTVTQAGLPCLVTISPTSLNLTSSIAASGNVVVTASVTCGWTAASNDAWITIGVGATGTGNGNVAYNVASNTSATSRTGTMTIGGQTFTLMQPGAPCGTTISPSSSNLTTPAAAIGSVTVTTGTGCGWTAGSNAAWITVTAGASGSGSGSVSYSVDANTGTTSRSGTMTIGGQTFSVTQAGATCTFTISPVSMDLTTAAATSGTVTVSASPGCNWVATSSAAWISITAGANGTGDGAVTYSVAANTSTVSRTGTLSIAGQTFTVNQAGAPCTFSLMPTSSNLTFATATTGVVNVSSSAGCSWTATSNDSWLTITSGSSGSGGGSVNYSVAANTLTTSRYWYADDWRTNIQRHSGGSNLLVHDFADQSVATGKRRHRHSDRDYVQQLQLDRVEPRGVGDDHQRRERNRLGNGGLHGGCKYGHDCEDRYADHRRQIVHGERIGHDVLRLGLADGRHRTICRCHGHAHGDDYRGLHLDEFIERRVGDRDRLGQRSR